MVIPHPQGFDLTGVRDVFEDSVSTVAWLVAVGGAIGWCYFWVMVAQLHLSRGDVIGAISTFVLFVGGIIILLFWTISRRVNLNSFRPSDQG